ncbi:CoA transferase [Bradyrhizobium japonicum]
MSNRSTSSSGTQPTETSIAGLDRKSLETLNPNVIFCQVDCFGGPRRGSRSDDLGYDDIARAVSGIMLRFGGSSETPEGTRTWDDRRLGCI